MEKKTYYIALSALGCFLFFYVLKRAALLSLTHDESATTDLVSVSLNDIMFARNQFQTANNHILHSIFMKWSVLLFGWKEWSIRLPNVLFFILYFSASAWFAARLTSTGLYRLLIICILCSAPYLLDFFSLARGYGMANALSLGAMVSMLVYFQDGQKKYIAISFLFAAFAVYANFTWLNVYLGLWALLNTGYVLFNYTAKQKAWFKKLLLLNVYPLFILILLAVLIYKPVTYLRQQDEFKWGTSEWFASLKQFATDLLYGRPLPFASPELSVKLFSYALLFAVTVTFIICVRHLKRSATFAFQSFHAKATLLSLLLLCIIAVSTVAQRHLLNTQYIDGRKATLYIPVLLCLSAAGCIWLKEKYQQAGTMLLSFISAICILQFILSFNFKSCREWWYDANSKQAYAFICADTASSKKTAVNWLFIHSFSVYNQHFYKNCLPSITRTDAAPDQLKEIDYYYIIGDEIKNIHPVYKPVKRFFWDRFVLKKDEAAYQAAVTEYLKQQKTLPAITDEALYRIADSALIQQRKEINWSALYFSN